jgi:hypothetical protein
MKITTLALLIATSVTVAQADFPKPVKQDIEGWPVFVGPELLKPENSDVWQKASRALQHKLFMIKTVMPENRLHELQKLEIRIELKNPKLSNMQYHPSRDWLVNHGHDPALTRQVHIPNARALYDEQQILKHPWVVLHELAHSYHDQVLGFDHAGIKAAYQKAVRDKKYDAVLLYSGQTVKHYAVTDHKEFFAEFTESYFGMNDFYPFLYVELKQYDPDLFLLMQSIWGKRP